MSVLFSLMVATLLEAVALAVPGPAYVQHETRDILTPGASQWLKRSRAPIEAIIPLRIALKQQNLDHGHNVLMDISDPDSPRFAQHLAPELIGALFQPHDDTVKQVQSWLSREGIASARQTLSPGRGYIMVNSTIGEAEKLLKSTYYVFEHATTSQEHVAADDYHVPRDIHPHIDFVSPTVAYRPLSKHVDRRDSSSVHPAGHLRPRLRRVPDDYSLAVKSDPLRLCYASVTPDCIRAMYGIPRGNTSVKGNTLGVFESLDVYDKVDLDDFWQTYAPYVPQGTYPKLDSIDGGVAPVPLGPEAGAESCVDFEVAQSLIYPQTTILYEVDDQEFVNHPTAFKGFGDTFLDALDASFCTYKGGDNKTIDPHYPDGLGYNKTEMCGTYKPTTVISFSYAYPEFYFTPFYEQRQCYKYMKLGLAGTTAVWASGDDGVGSPFGCFNDSSKPQLFAPLFPASCPYVLTVGGTELPFGKGVHARQVAVSDFRYNYTSGGGFSNSFGRPFYQHDAVASYLAQYAPSYPRGTYNKSGRAYPDVSAISENVATYYGGQPYLADGTSVSTPVWAAIVTLLNEHRMSAGKKPIGFINPTLYKNPHMFTDVISGSNPGCGTPGFEASPGWDPVTGLGTPRFDKLLKVFMGLP